MYPGKKVGTLTKCQGMGPGKLRHQLELNLTKDANNNNKGFYEYIGQIMTIKENISP